MANDLTKFDPDVARQQASDDLVRASVLNVTDAELCYMAREIRRRNNLLLKQAESHYKEVKGPMNEAVKSIRRMEARDCEPMEMVIERLDPLIIAFEEEEEKRQKEMSLSLENQARERAQLQRDDEIARLEASGKHQQVDELLKRQLFVPPIVIPERRDWLEGEGRKTEWYVKEDKINLVELAAAVASGQLPPTAIKPHLPTLDNLAEATKDTGKIPGCEIDRRTVITQRKS